MEMVILGETAIKLLFIVVSPDVKLLVSWTIIAVDVDLAPVVGITRVTL